MAKKDYYKILGITKEATPEQIKKAYKKLAFDHHPDYNKDPNSHKIFDELAEAYDTLSNPISRAKYDEYGISADSSKSDNIYERFSAQYQLEDLLNEIGKTESHPKKQESHPTKPHHTQDNSHMVGFNINASTPPKKAQGVAPVDLSKYDVTSDIFITKEEAALGTTRQLDISRRGSFETHTVDVFIPSGSKRGDRIKVPHAGAESPFGERGHLWLSVKIEEETEPIERKEEKGNDFETKIQLPYSLFCLGGEIRVETPQGFITLPIESGASPDKTITVKGKGYLPQQGQGEPGDLKLRLLLLTYEAKNLTPEQKRILEEARKVGL
jgi:curved DNA-binding protein